MVISAGGWSRMAAGVALAVVAASAGCGLGTNATPEPTCVPAAVPTVRPPATTAGDGHSLRVVESGFARLPYAAFVQVGLLIENPSTEVAYATSVSVTVHAADGSVLLAPGSESQQTQTIPAIGPGARVGFGASIGQPPLSTTPPAYLTVEIGPSFWAPGGHTAPSVSDLRVRVTEGTQPYGGVTFTLQSGACTDLPSHGVATLYRDHDGTLIGGSRDPQSPIRCPATPATAHVSLPELSPDLDATRVEVYPYCDPGIATESSAAPVPGIMWTLTKP